MVGIIIIIIFVPTSVALCICTCMDVRVCMHACMYGYMHAWRYEGMCRINNRGVHVCMVCMYVFHVRTCYTYFPKCCMDNAPTHPGM